MATTHLPSAQRELPFDRALPALRLIPPSNNVRALARSLKVLLVLLPTALCFVPWQQTVKGYGRVVAYQPTERPQTLQAPVAGRVKHVWVIEGQHVTKDQPLIELEDNDPQLLDNLKRQRSAIEMKLNFAKAKVEVYTRNVTETEHARDAALAKAESEIAGARQKIRAAEQEVEERDAELLQARQSAERIANLHKSGLASTNDLEIAQRTLKVAENKAEKARAYLEADRRDLDAKTSDMGKIDREARSKIEQAKAYVQEAQGDVQLTEKELATLDVTINRQDQIILSPKAGVVDKVWVNNNAEMLKAGDRLVTIVPDTDQRAVELFIDGNDASLIQGLNWNKQDYAEAAAGEGQLVRLQFEGWPAVQFSGWPSVAVGTFGGRIAAVNPTDDGKGKFRILVVPHVGENDRPWPSGRYLRQGVRSTGWVLLNQVPLGWEFWRQLNGFPPVVAETEPKDDIKLPKVPK